MTLEQVRQRLRTEMLEFVGTGSVGQHGFGLRGWCEEHDVAAGHASEFLNGKRAPATDLLDALGLEWQLVEKKT